MLKMDVVPYRLANSYQSCLVSQCLHRRVKQLSLLALVDAEGERYYFQ